MISRFTKANNRLRLIGSLILSSAIISNAIPAHATNALGDPANRAVVGKNGAAGGLKAVEAETKAGDITVGSTTQVVVKFRNESAQEVRVGAINLYPSSTVGAEVALNECGGAEAIPSGAECAIVVSVKGLKIGNWRVEVLLRHDGKSRIVTAAMLGTIAAGDEKTDVLLSDVEMIPNEIDFGSLNSSRPLVKSVILRNITSNKIKVGKVSIEAAPQSGYTLSTDCDELAAGQACMAAITWSPMTPGKSDGILVAQHDGPTRVSSVTLKGDYQPKAVTKADIFPEAVPGAGLLVSSQEEINFDKVTNEASMTVSLVNVGDQEMQIKDISLASSDKGLSIANTGCHPNTVLQPIEACALTINWSPVRVGEIIEDVRIYHDGARGVLVIPIRGSSDTAINRDTKAVVVGTKDSPETAIRPVEKRQALEGFVISSHSNNKAILNGPGGSRVVTQGKTVVLGGIEWQVNIVENGVEFLNGNDRVRLLFDRSLSSASRSTTTTSSSSSSGSSTSSGTSSTSTPATTQ